MRTTVTFNGYAITDDYYVSDLRTALLPAEIGSKTVPGMDGAKFTGSTIAAKDITLTITAKGSTLAARQTAARALAAALAVSEPKPLAFSVDGGKYYLAIPTSTGDARNFYNHTSFDVTFRCLDPVMYGETKAVTLSNSTAKSVDIGGTYPTQPIITSSNCYGQSSSNGYIKITNETTGEFVQVPCANADTHTLEVDCAKRYAKVDSATVGPTLESDWLSFAPGTISLKRALGYGTYTITYQERWL